jgi:outer membrane protein TolC
MLQFIVRSNVPIKSFATVMLLFCMLESHAQEVKTLSLQEAYQLSEANFPVIKRRNLIKESEELAVRNLSSTYLPQLIFNGQMTYQSDVVDISLPLPGVEFPVQPKDQYKFTADVNQMIFDGGVSSGQKNIQHLNATVEQNKVSVDLYQLKNRVNQLFFDVLYQDELRKQNELAIKDIQTGIDKVKPQVNNGVMLRSNLHVLEAQLLQGQQRDVEISNTRKGLMDALSVLMNKELNEQTVLEPPVDIAAIDTLVTRPELALYESQSKLIEGQQQLITSKILPRTSLFFQGGYGKPGLDFLSSNFAFFYITGVRLNWSLGDLYNTKRERRIVDLDKENVNVQKEIFLLNTKSQLKQQRAEIEKFEQLVATDQEIINLRFRVTEAAKVQLENSVITASDYIREVNAESLARQQLASHRLQLLQSKINYLLISGKY